MLVTYDFSLLLSAAGKPQGKFVSAKLQELIEKAKRVQESQQREFSRLESYLTSDEYWSKCV